MMETQEAFNTKTGATGVVAHDWSTGSIWVHSSIAANFTANITNLPSLTGKSAVVTLVLQQSVTPFYASAMQINSTAQTIRWLSGTAPVPIASAFEAQIFTIFQTGASTYIVLGQLGSFA